MNAHLDPRATRYQQTRREAWRDFLSLARTQRNLACQARTEAKQAEADGRHDRYVKAAAEARRLFRAARWHLQHARLLRPGSKS